MNIFPLRSGKRQNTHFSTVILCYTRILAIGIKQDKRKLKILRKQFHTASQRIKYPKMNLTKEVKDWYSENYKIC